MTEDFADITADDTAGRGRAGGRARRWFVGPPGPVFGVLVAANAVLLLVADAAPGRYFFAWVASAALWIGLGLAFVVRLGLAVALDGGWRGLLSRWLRWAAVPALVVATASAAYAGVPMRAGLQLAKPAMVDFASGSVEHAPVRVGPYRVERAERLPGGGARFVIAGAGFIDAAGFVYSPDGAPPRIGDDDYEHLSGPWYAWIEHF